MICDDVVEEARRLLSEAARRELPLRALGGVAVSLHTGHDAIPALARRYEDIDLATLRKARAGVARLLVELGYEANERFNMSNETRLVFYDPGRPRHIDVFVGGFSLCHDVPVTDRIDADPLTVPLAELLLTKLQVVQLTRKDLQDAYALLHAHEVGEGDVETIDAGVVAGLCAGDWGLWRTVGGTLAEARARLPESTLSEQEQAVVERRIDELLVRLEREPKSLRWKARARVGDRVRWYQEPEEIEHGHGGVSAPAGGAGR